MIKELVHDPLFLGIKSKPAVKEDILVGRDLLDTLMAHKETCVGMAANMIGVTKRIIAFSDNGKYAVMYNPQIVGKSGAYQRLPLAARRSPTLHALQDHPRKVSG